MSTNRLSLNQPYARLSGTTATAATYTGGSEGRFLSVNLAGFKIVAMQVQFCNANAYGAAYNGGAYFDSRNNGPNSGTSNILHTMQSITNTMYCEGLLPWYQQSSQYQNYIGEATTGLSQNMTGSESAGGNSMAHAASFFFHRPNTLSQLSYYMRTHGNGYHVAPDNSQPAVIKVWEFETL